MFEIQIKKTVGDGCSVHHVTVNPNHAREREIPYGDVDEAAVAADLTARRARIESSARDAPSPTESVPELMAVGPLYLQR
jgi:hypothetical protein